MKRIAFFFNEGAGNCDATEGIRNARRKIWAWHCDFHAPESVEDLHSIIDDLDPTIVDAIVIAGGDGSFNCALPALLRSEIPAYVFPQGTANDFARELGVQPDIDQLEQLISDRSIIGVDVIEANGVPFVTVGGIGVGAVMCDKLNSLRSRSKLFRLACKHMNDQMYAVMTGQTILFDKRYRHRVQVTVNGESFEETVPSLILANQTSLGSDIQVCRHAKNNDGLFEVCMITRESSLDLLYSVLVAKQRQCMPIDKYISASELVVKDLDDKPMRVFGDGEILTEATEINFTLKHRALKVFGAKQAIGSGADEDSDNG